MENERESVSLTIHKTSHNRDYTIYNILPKRIQIFSQKNESFLLKVRTNTWDIHHIHVNIKHRLTYTVNRLYPLLVDKHCRGYMLMII